jgi:hypothetical protein
MGGFGSGRHNSWSAKTTTESQHRVDIRWMKRQGYLRPGAVGLLSWSRGNEQTGSIGYRMEEDRMMLNYNHRPRGEEWEQVEQKIIFDRTSCNYGGYRKWFLCPRCWKRVAVLYGAGKFFLCRHCYDLAYGSQKEGKADRLMRRARRIRQRLGASDNLFEPIGFKPKNMHWKTFDRLRKEAVHANNLSWLLMGKRLGIRF